VEDFVAKGLPLLLPETFDILKLGRVLRYKGTTLENISNIA